MAEAWTGPDNDASKDGGVSARPFDRQALQATLADAVRTASDVEKMDTPPNKPLRGPTPSSPVISGSAEAAGEPVLPPQPQPQPQPQPARSVNPFSRGASASEGTAATAPASAPAPAPAIPAPKRPASLLGGGTPTSVGSSQGAGLGSSGGLGSGGGLSGGGLGAPGAAGSAGLRGVGSGNLGPINFSGDNRGSGDLGGGRSAAALAPAPAEQPTIALRRRQPAEAAPSARSGQNNPSATPAPAAPPAPPRAAVSIEGWSPTDDDILPRRVMKRSLRRH
jgi:hypothetical protein